MDIFQFGSEYHSPAYTGDNLPCLKASEATPNLDQRLYGVDPFRVLLATSVSNYTFLSLAALTDAYWAQFLRWPT